MSRLLVLRPGALGDTLLAVPALRALRRRFRGSSLHLIGNPGAAALLQLCGEIDDFTDFDAPSVAGLFSTSGSAELLRSLQPIRAAVAWLSDPSGLVERHLRAAGIPKVLIAASRADPSCRAHMADYLVDSLAGWGVGQPGNEPLRLPASPHVGKSGPALLLHPGSGSARKNWSSEGFASVIRALGARVPGGIALLAGPADEAACAAVSSAVEAQLPALRPPTVVRLAEVLQSSRALLGNDSGVSHLAAALGVPTVALFGPTDPVLWAPRGRWVRVLPFESTPGEVCAAALDALEAGGARL